jgi:7-keto-8-aminopelargonate synthetase-like enzyme
MIFSGPIAPAGLGAGVASAQLHLTAEFENLQAELRARITLARAALRSSGLSPATDDETPIVVLHYDSAQAVRAVVAALRKRGFFTCVSTFPAVPINKPSLRFTLSRHNSLTEVRAMVEALVDVSTEVAPSMERQAPLAASSS